LRSEAVAALSRFDNSVVINNLVQALNKDENSFVRRSAAKALGNIRSEIAIEALAKALKNDKDSSMRLDAAQELSSINNDIATEALEQALKDEHSLVRCEAAEALVKVGNKAAINTLIQALYDEDSSMRRKAVALLSKVNHETAINALVQVLNNDRDFSVRLDAAKALGSISNNKAAINALEQALHKDKVSDVRWCAAQELGRIGNESAIKFLVQALKNKKFDVRLKAFSQLEAIDNEIVVAALIQGLHDKVDGIRWCAVSALGRISNEAAIEALVQALNNENFSVRWRAAEQLGKIDDESGIDVLVEALIKKEDDQNRRAIADVLGRFNNEVAINALIQALKNDGDFHVRWSAVRTLGRRGNEAAINALVQALKDDSNFHLRSTIASILGGFDNKAVINALIEALKDEDSVRHSALQALGKIAPSELLPQFLKLLQINGEDYLLNTISAIQERCKYYNYTLTQSETPLQPQLNVPVSVMHILHLSDLHFGTSDNATNWYNQLANDLIHELERPPLNALILSGDIANKSTPDEYTAAKEFLDKLCKEFHLQKEQVIIVPGNHDLNWEISKKEGYKPLRREEFNGLEDESLFIDSGGNYIEVLDPEQYKRRFEYFSNFYKTIKGTEYPTDYDRQYTLDRIDNLLILGLNSAWQLDHHYKARASIKPAALSNAFEEIRRNPEYQNCQKIAVWHHPINSSFEDRIKDSKFLDQLAINGFRLFLHGHLHETQKGFNEYDAERGLYRICAGTFGAPTKELPTATAWQYHLLKFEGDKVTVRSRKRQSETGAWESDSCWRQGRGKHSLDWYEIQPFET
jgi:HEAT repeat protein/3',5'-cyclic AMP phosphodiesterase CpdA